MLELPLILPPGESYVRIPRSKSAAMRVILETVQRGSRYWTGGVIDIGKALRLAEKFAQRYSTDASQSRRSWNKSQGRANSTLVMYPEDDKALTPMRWWLLVTPGTGLVFKEERLLDTWEKRQRLTWGEQYELVHLQHGRTYGGGRHWTWRVSEQRYAELEASMQQYASAHGIRSRESGVLAPLRMERRDDLASLVEAISRMPGFHGMRMQQMALYLLGRECWNRTHKTEYPGWPKDVPYVDKRQMVYHRPHALTLDVLMRIYEARSSMLEVAAQADVMNSTG